MAWITSIINCQKYKFKIFYLNNKNIVCLFICLWDSYGTDTVSWLQQGDLWSSFFTGDNL